MKINRQITILVVLWFAVAIVCSAGFSSHAQAEDKPIKLTYAFFAPARTFPGKQMAQWAQEIEKRTNGLVTVQTFPGSTLLGARDMYDGVLRGVADIGLGSPSYDPGRFPLTSGVALPVNFPNATVASLTLLDLMMEFKPVEYDKFKIITMFTTEPGHIQSRNQVENLNELKGMKLRAAGTGVPVLKALGAAPVGMPMPQVPESVQTGVIDGTMTSREVLKDFKLAELSAPRDRISHRGCHICGGDGQEKMGPPSRECPKGHRRPFPRNGRMDGAVPRQAERGRGARLGAKKSQPSDPQALGRRKSPMGCPAGTHGAGLANRDGSQGPARR